MATKRKTTLAEAMGQYADPFEAAQALRTMADDIDKVAGKIGSTELMAFQCAGPLGLGNPIELHSLQTLGLHVYERSGSWCVDSREFRRWANGQIARLNQRNKTYKRPEPVFGPQELF